MNVLCLPETWMNETDEIRRFAIKKFHKIIRNNRKTRSGKTMMQLSGKRKLDRTTTY